jgi:hypothetical protein
MGRAWLLPMPYLPGFPFRQIPSLWLALQPL